MSGEHNSLRPLGSQISEEIRPPSRSQFSSLVLLLLLPGAPHIVEMVVKQDGGFAAATGGAPSSWLKVGTSFSLPTVITWRLSEDGDGEGW